MPYDRKGVSIEQEGPNVLSVRSDKLKDGTYLPFPVSAFLQQQIVQNV